jgi:thiosulfate/3-mercaptopyruvate sulfurtransferase
MFDTLIKPPELAERLSTPGWVVVDCRMDLTRPDAGRTEYEAGHIPGAVYAHLDEDLSGPPITNRGRHPLPTPDALIATFRRFGIGPRSQVVAYDTAGGSIAARLWWMLHYMGHAAAAVLDGGWQAWAAAGLPSEQGARVNTLGDFYGSAHEDWVVNVDEVVRVPLLIDARDPPRYRGEQEPLDPKAGHIPGAINYFWRENLDHQGAFLPAPQLRERLGARLAEYAADKAACYCGSGVTACHNILAMAYTGLGMPRLYAGSWSEWCTDERRPIATGPGR